MHRILDARMGEDAFPIYNDLGALIICPAIVTQGNRMSVRFLLAINNLNTESLSIIHEVMAY